VSQTMVKSVLAIALIVAFMGLAHQASALSFQDANYIGLVTDGAPADEASEVGYINNLITLAAGQGDTQIPPVTGEIYNRVGSTINCGTLPCPTAVLAGNSGNINSQDDGSDIDVTGFTYLLGKYDGPNEGSAVWYVGDLTGLQDIPDSCCGTTLYGLSHYVLFNPGTTTVPEPSTLVLLGLTLSGAAFLGRRMRTKA
jgi:PEP-CTERM motif